MCYTSLSLVPGHIGMCFVSKSISNILGKSYENTHHSLSWTWQLGKCLCPQSVSVFFSIMMAFWWLHFQIGLCISTWTTVTGSLAFAASTATFHTTRAFVEAQKINLKVLLQIESNKTTLLCSLSWGYPADKVPGCPVTRWPISAEFERSNEPWGNKGSLITTPKPSCHPQPAPQMSHWQPRHSWGHRCKILQPTQLSLFSATCEWTVSDIKVMGTVFEIWALFIRVLRWRR